LTRAPTPAAWVYNRDPKMHTIEPSSLKSLTSRRPADDKPRQNRVSNLRRRLRTQQARSTPPKNRLNAHPCRGVDSCETGASRSSNQIGGGYVREPDRDDDSSNTRPDRHPRRSRVRAGNAHRLGSPGGAGPSECSNGQRFVI